MLTVCQPPCTRTNDSSTCSSLLQIATELALVWIRSPFFKSGAHGGCRRLSITERLGSHAGPQQQQVLLYQPQQQNYHVGASCITDSSSAALRSSTTSSTSDRFTTWLAGEKRPQNQEGLLRGLGERHLNLEEAIFGSPEKEDAKEERKLAQVRRVYREEK